jgi:hypothetical protein
VLFTDDADLEALAESIAPEAVVLLNGWQNLAQAFLTHLDHDNQPIPVGLLYVDRQAE